MNLVLIQYFIGLLHNDKLSPFCVIIDKCNVVKNGGDTIQIIEYKWSGVPQVSNWGSFPYLVNINDLPSVMPCPVACLWLYLTLSLNCDSSIHHCSRPYKYFVQGVTYTKKIAYSKCNVIFYGYPSQLHRGWTWLCVCVGVGVDVGMWVWMCDYVHYSGTASPLQASNSQCEKSLKIRVTE